MDRGFNFGSVFQGNNRSGNFQGGNQGPNFRERADRSDRRYDDFYADRNRGPPAGGPNRNGGGGGGGGVRRTGQDWNGAGQHGMVGPNVPAAQLTGGLSGPVLNALQQQSILNALMNSTQAAQKLPPRNQNHNQNMNGQNRRPAYQGNSRFNNSRRGSAGGGPRPGEKRKSDAAPSGFNKGRKFESPTAKKKTGSTTKDSPKKEKEEPKVEEIEIPDDEVEVPDSLMDSVEKLRQRKEVERNVADEDVQKLLVFCFTGKGYQCKTCGLLLMKESAFLSHLMGKSHVMNVIDARTAKKYQEIRDILEIDLTPDDWFEQNENARAIIMKQSKLHMKTQREIKQREEANFNKTPSNFFNFNMELRKSVTKKDDKVVITSLVESTVEVKDFTGEKFFGCEFVRAVTGFHCRLCSINIREARGVLPHVDSRQHKNNYAAYIRKNADYEKTQKEQNQDLFDIMSQHENKSVVLAESADVEKSHFLSLVDPELVRIPSVMNPELKKEKEEKERKEKEEAAAAVAAAEKEKADAEASEAAGDEEEKDDDQEADAEGDGEDAEQEEEGGEEAADEEQEGEEEDVEEAVEEEQEGEEAEVEADAEVEGEAEAEAEEEPMEQETEEKKEVAEEADPYAETTSSKKKTPAKPAAKAKKAAEKAKTPAKKPVKPKSTPKAKKPAAKGKEVEEETDAVPDGFEVVDEVEDDATA